MPAVESGPAAAVQAAEEAKALRAEDRVAGFRAGIIAFNVVAYYFFMDHEGTIPWLAATVTIVAALYAVLSLAFRPQRRFPVMATSAATATTDSVLIVLWLVATGGASSPFFLLWFLSLVAIAFRYGAGPTAAVTPVYAFLDLAQAYVVSGASGLGGLGAGLLVRPVYIAFVGGLGALMAKDSREAHEDRAQSQLELVRLQEQSRRREADQARWQALAAASQEGLAIHEEGVILEANAVLAGILGRPVETLRGARIRDLIGEKEWDAQRRVANRAPGGPYLLTVRRPDGSEAMVEAAARDAEFQGRPVRVVSVRDVTEERHAEDVRRRAAAQEQEIERLQAVDRFKTTFINTAAHELNTPITPLMLQLHLLRLAGRSPDDARRSVDILERNLRRLSALVSDMLDVARLQSGRLRMDPGPVDVAALLGHEYDTFAQQAREGGVELTLDAPEPFVVWADPVRVAQVAANLVSNAIKFTPRGGRVEVRVRGASGASGSAPPLVATQERERAWIEVEDSGVGLTAEQQRHLFQPFTRLHDSLPAGGTGLGLYISHGLVAQMGGQLHCRSEGPDEGSTFSFDLPVAPMPARGDRPATRPSPGPDRPVPRRGRPAPPR